MTRRTPLAAVAALLLAGCASVPNVSPQLSAIAPSALGIPAGETQTIADDWWTVFGDPQLNKLEEMGLAGNPDLAGALARVRAAQAAVGVRQSAELPRVALDAKVPRQRYPENYILPPPLGGSTFWVPQIEGTLNWDLDLFGRNKAAVRRAKAGAQAIELDAAAARITISTAIAQGYVGLTHAERQIAVAQGFVETRQQALSLVQARIKSQLASQFDLEQAKTLLAEAEQAQVRALGQYELMIHALAALVGRGPDFYAQISAPTLALDNAPAVPDTLPADLLGRRADLLAGRTRIEAALAGRDVAKAEFLPNVNIVALFGTLSLGLDNVFKGSSTEYGVGPAIHLPIFEGGRLKANYTGAVAEIDESIAGYNGAVLTAVRDAADAITGVQASDRDLAAQLRIVSGLRETVRLDQVRVDTGLGSRLDAIDSGFRLLAAEQTLIELQARAFNRRIQLIAALGGGFNPENMAQAATPAGKKQS
jgi:NodT family efflux transporter outer membrane factor (OMF) lipoprotein